MKSEIYNNVLEDSGLVVRVLEYDATTCTQVGEFAGTPTDEKLGFSMDLLSDGSTLVIGSPNTDTGGSDDNTGAVLIYSFNTTDSTWSLELVLASDDSLK